MAGKGINMLSFIKIIKQSFSNFITEINKWLIATFSDNFYTAVIEVYVIYINSNALRHTDPGTKHKSKQGEIPFLGLFMI